MAWGSSKKCVYAEFNKKYFSAFLLTISEESRVLLSESFRSLQFCKPLCTTSSLHLLRRPYRARSSAHKVFSRRSSRNLAHSWDLDLCSTLVHQAVYCRSSTSTMHLVSDAYGRSFFKVKLAFKGVRLEVFNM